MNIEVVIPESEALNEFVCPGKRDSMLREPSAKLYSG
jgi:hypothetical protein